ncbi:hypothetical protein PNEG_00848 [Pneumocystis murina B123]|uniref:Uncharacterized protein n=1 Tax=Pneumocystis murina (strain B123) TaxID=1069680 RepID=M7NTV0_PNEMU|nr:hypothetical protein PNEG_00848 [Pneumocystis murina B123]EMR10697.1 hypothetical protein PNEG_00848 [Pneumocystis murina B123]
MNPLLPFSTILSREKSYEFGSYSKRDYISNTEKFRKICSLNDPNRFNLKREHDYEYEEDLLVEQPYVHIQYHQRNKDFNKKRRDLTPISLFNEAITNAIEEGEEVLQLSECNIVEIPENISELTSLVRRLDPENEKPLIPRLKIFLSGNMIYKLPSGLFDLFTLTVLSLRNNDLKMIPSSIGRLVNLVELNLGQNKLTYFPSTLLFLKKLQILSISPNPLRDCPIAYSSQTSFQSLTSPVLRYSCVDLIKTDSNVPKLLELSARVIASSLIAKSDIQKWETKFCFIPKIKKAYEAGKYHISCEICQKPMVDSDVDVFEWWDGFVGTWSLPIKRKICSLLCFKNIPRVETPFSSDESQIL